MSTLSWFLPSIAALILWGGSGFLPKLAVRRLPPLDVIVYQYLFFFLSALVVLAFYGFQLVFDPAGVALSLAVGITGTIGQILFVFALSKGPFSQVSVVTSLYPVVVTALSILILHETVTQRQTLGIALGIAAIVVMVKSHDE